MTKKKEDEVVVKKESAYIPKKTNRSLIVAMIIVAVFFILVTVVAPIAFTVYVLFLSVKTTEFKVIDNNTIEISNIGMKVSIENSKYDKENNCYVLSTKSELFDKDKYKKTKLMSDTINVTYSFIDEDGYVVGSETLFIDSLDKYDKWRQTVSFCGEHASSVKSYEVESVDSY